MKLTSDSVELLTDIVSLFKNDFQITLSHDFIILKNNKTKKKDIIPSDNDSLIAYISEKSKIKEYESR